MHWTAGTIAGLAALAFLAEGCRDPFSSDERVVLRIEAIDAPAAVAPDASVTVTVTAVTGGCISFEKLEVQRSATLLTIVARGRDRTRPGIFCTGEIRYEPHQFTAQPPFLDPLTIVGKQPDGTELTRQVRVQ